MTSFFAPTALKDSSSTKGSKTRQLDDVTTSSPRINFGMGVAVAGLGAMDTVLGGVGRALNRGLIHGTGLMMASMLNENGYEGLGTVVGLGVSGSLARTMLRASRPLPMLMAGLGLIGLANNGRAFFKLPLLTQRAPSVALTTVSCHM